MPRNYQKQPDRPLKYPFDRLQPGESVFLPDTIVRLPSIFHRYGKANGYKFRASLKNKDGTSRNGTLLTRIK